MNCRAGFFVSKCKVFVSVETVLFKKSRKAAPSRIALHQNCAKRAVSLSPISYPVNERTHLRARLWHSVKGLTIRDAG
jgi:hypothetical protein